MNDVYKTIGERLCGAQRVMLEKKLWTIGMPQNVISYHKALTVSYKELFSSYQYQIPSFLSSDDYLAWTD